MIYTAHFCDGQAPARNEPIATVPDDVPKLLFARLCDVDFKTSPTFCRGVKMLCGPGDWESNLEDLLSGGTAI